MNDPDRSHSKGAVPQPSMPSHIMQYFAYSHLPEGLQHVSKPFCELANLIECTHLPNPEKSVALRKLLEAKDAAVRSALSR